MIEVYVGEKPPAQFSKSIFLAGPTPRSASVSSWRPEALSLLASLGYDGVVFIPETRAGGLGTYYPDQVEWEETHLNMSDVIVFWIPRNMETLPGLTTNNEWGRLEESGRVVLGTPAQAEHVRYQRYYAQKRFVPTADTLIDTLKHALAQIGDGALREGGQRDVPLFVWRTTSFQQWHNAHTAVGNRLDGAVVKWVFRVGPQKKFMFMWIMHVNIHIASENRNKVNEFVIARPDISTIIMYRRRPDILDSEILLVREFRSPVSNETGFVWEAPGGSSIKGGTDPKILAAEECHEETGITVDPSRIVIHEARQLAATLSAHKSHVFSIELTDEQMVAARADHGNPHGLIADSEMTFTEVRTLREILNGTYVDWSMIGMIASVLQGK